MMRRGVLSALSGFLSSVRFHSTRYFTDTDEWVEYDNGVATIGITTYAKEHLGDIVYIQFPDVGEEVDVGKAFCEVESVKATSSVYSPVKGVVDTVNNKLVEDPSTINKSAEGDGWLVKVKCSDMPQDLMTAEQYEKFTKGEN